MDGEEDPAGQNLMDKRPVTKEAVEDINLENELIVTKSETIWEPPDGGYAWVIMIISCLNFFLFASFTQLGVLILPLQEYFQVSKSTITCIIAVHTVTGRICGIFAGQFLHKYGGRPTMTVGILSISIGFFISSFVDSIPVLFLTFGIIPSLGFGFIYSVASSYPQMYFRRKRSLAAGGSYSGISIATFCWPPLCNKLIEDFGWHGAFRIESAIYLVLGTVIIIFLRPPGHHNSLLGFDMNCFKTKTDEEKEKSVSNEKNKCTCCRITKLLNFSILRNPILVLYLVTFTFSAMGYLVVSIYLPVRAKLLGLDAASAAFQTSVNGIVVLVATPLCGIFGNLPGVSRHRDVLMVAAVLILGILVFISTILTSTIGLFVMAGVFGIFCGCFLSVHFVVVVDIVGPKMAAIASGFFAASFGVAHLTVHPLSGWLLDETRNAQAPFYMAGVTLLLGGLSMVFVPIMRFRNARRDSKKEHYNSKSVQI